jgi:hypothetical protein
MASKDIINPVDINNPSSTRRSADLLPTYHRTDRNTKFLASTLDQFIQQPQIKRVNGFVGSKLSLNYNPSSDEYIDGTTQLRNNYQLEPSLIISDVDKNIKTALGYDDLINQLAFNNAKVDNLDKLFHPRSYSYDPQIDWDKFVNFRQYYWMPTGPDSVEILGKQKNTVSTYTVKDSEDGGTLIFTPDGGTTNPLLTLYRGLTYVFNVTSKFPFYVKTSYTTGIQNLYSGVTNNGTKVGQVIVTIDEFTPTKLFYFAEGNPSAVGQFVVKELEEATQLDIEKDILGKQTYSSANRVTLSNGMKVRFVGSVTPESYLDKDWIVEGVGSAITLIDFSTLQTVGIETSNLNVNFDASPFDEYPFDDFRYIPLTPEYVTINRAATDKNPWSRYNRWVHEDVIAATANANGVPAVFPADRRAQRPIIEFIAGLQLFNYGAVGKETIDIIDNVTTDAFRKVENTPGYYVDGVLLEAGYRVIFNADTDPLVRGKVYEVKIAIIDGNQRINLEEVLDSTPLLNEAVLVRRGTQYAGSSWWFDGSTWIFGQQKTTLNQAPLWELYDDAGNRYSDQSVYRSSFSGTKLFGYEIGTVSDPVLGFPLAYRNVANVGEYLFDNFYMTDTFTIFVNGSVQVENVSNGFLKINSATDSFYKTVWTKTVDKPIPIFQYQVITEESIFIELNAINKPGYAKDLTVEVFVNDVKQLLNTDFVKTNDGDRSFVVSTTGFSVNDRVLIKLYTSQSPNENGYYETPINLTNNPLNLSITKFTFTELSDHVKTMVDFNGEFKGVFPGSSNLRDLANLSSYGSRLVSHQNPISFAHYFLGQLDHNIIDAVRKVSVDYNQFKSNLVRAITDLKGNYSPSQSLDYALIKLNATKDTTFSYKNSDMLPYGNDCVTRIFTVTDRRNTRYNLASIFNDNVLGERAVLIYLNNQLLTKDYDYEINKFDPSFTINVSLTKGDVITVLDYPSTVGSYIPPTPTKLGLYPKFKPAIYFDDTYVGEPRQVIQGHDGSITVAYGDYRDAVLLEYETRVYNNLKVNYNPDLVSIDASRPGAFRSNGISQDDATSLVTPDFLRWAGFFGVDYQTNFGFDELDAFTFNHTGTVDPLTKRSLKGHWRGIYKYYYDTDRPHTHPWEMLGFSEQPTWWVDTYGPAPYTSGNLLLWNDLEAGRIAVTPSGPVINEIYARPGLSKIIPVSDSGELLSPTDSGLASTPIVNLADPKRVVMLRSEQIAAKWAIGDYSPAETAWRRSSYWPFACQVMLALSQPASYAALMFDTSRIKTNLAGEVRYGDSNSFISPSSVLLFNDVVNEQRVLASGYSVYIVEAGTAKSENCIQEMKDDLSKVTYQLMVKLGAFASKDKLSVGIDAVDPSSPYPGVLIPSEDYQIFFNKGSPIESLSISGLIIQKSTTGWSVRGYDRYNPYFKILKPFASNVDQVERVGGISETFVQWNANTTYNESQIVFFSERYYRVKQKHNSGATFTLAYYQSLPYLPTVGGVGVLRRSSFSSNETIVPYGVEYRTQQEVYDLIVGYGKWLESKGFVFDEYNGTLDQVLDWRFTAKEFLYWTTQNWAPNAVITLSPFANKLEFRSDVGIVDSISNNFYEYSLLKADGAPFPKNNFTIVRLDGDFALSTMNTQEGIFFARLNLTQKEHALVMNNFTLFNDVIYSVETGYRQRRIKLKGFVTRDWNGDFFSPGFVFDQAVITDWKKFQDYGIGDVVRFSGNYYSAIKSIAGTATFDITQWAVLNEKPVAQLFPNFDYKINQFEDFYSLDIDNFDVGQQSMAQHLIGYNPRPYLNYIIGDPIAQYKFYQGFIRDKGSKKSLINLSKASINNLGSSVDFNEEWAFRIGYYGGFNTYQELEINLESTKFIENPQIIEFVQNKPVEPSSTVYYKNEAELVVKPQDFNINNVFSTTDYSDSIFKLPVAGYVRFDDITATAYNKNSVLDIANNAALKTGNVIWLGFREDGEWDALRVTEIPTYISAVAINIPGQSLTLTTFYAHQLNAGDLISVTGVASGIDQCYIVQEVTDPNRFVVLSILTSLPSLNNPVSGLLFAFKSSRLATFDEITSIPYLDRWSYGELVWVDADDTGKWAVYKKTNNYSSTVFNSASQVLGQHYGTRLATNNGSDVVIVASPDYALEGDNEWGRLFVLYKNSFDELEVKDNFSLNDGFGANNYVATLGNEATWYGYSLEFNSELGLVVAGAPKTSNVKALRAGTNIVDADLTVGSANTSTGVVKLSVITTNTYQLLDQSVVISTPTNNTGTNFGWSIALSKTASTNTQKLIVGAPALDTENVGGEVYVFEVSVSSATISISTGTLISHPPAGVGSRFGFDISGNSSLTRYAISDPGYMSISSVGAVYIFDNTGTQVQLITGDSLPNKMITGDLFGTSVEMSANGEYLAVSSPYAYDPSLGTRSGVVDIFRWAGSGFVHNQRISVPISALTTATTFGYDLSFNESAEILTVSSIGVAKAVRPTFDKYSEASTVTQYVNDSTSIEKKAKTTFDGGATTFFSKNDNVGTVHVYNRIGSNSTKWAHAQELIDSNVVSGSMYGSSVLTLDNSVYVGAPAKLLDGTNGANTGTGQIFIFNKIDVNNNSWALHRSQEPLVDIQPIKRAITIDSDSEQIKDYIDIIDPVKGNILGSAAEELKYITSYDPAIYSLGIAGVNVDSNTNWLDEHVGEVWWDLSTVKYVWYEQGELEYRKNNWNNLFPGSSVDIYEWVRSEYLPAEWAQLADTADGLTRGISGQPKFNDNSIISVKQVYNSVSNSFTNVYYYWVKNKITVPADAINRRKPVFEIAQELADPVTTGAKFLAVISPSAMILANSKVDVASEKINLNISFDYINDAANRHTEWLLLSENDPNSRPNWLLEKKLIDSLLGSDSLGNPVPDPALPSKLRYGVEVRPRQSLFVDRNEALRNIIEFSNSILIKEIVTGRIDFTNLTEIEPLPSPSSYDAIVEDQFNLELISTNSLVTAELQAVVDNNGQIARVIIVNQGFGYNTAPTVSIIGSGSGAVLQTNINQFGNITSVDVVDGGKNYTSDLLLRVRPYTVVVQADSNSAGKWAVYEWTTSKSEWVKVRTQDYNTSLFWKYVDWVSPTYDPLKNLASTVSEPYALEVLQRLAPGNYVKVQNGGDGRYLILRKTDGTGGSFEPDWDIVYSERGTIQFLDSIWNPAASLFAWDQIVGFDQTQYDQTPENEVKFILASLKDDIFINERKQYWNQLFFKAVRYAMSEQKFLDWAFKTTFISVVNNAGSLDQPATYKLGNSQYYEDFLKEVKPFHTKIRKFTEHYTSTELTKTFTSDFDLPVYYNTSTLNFSKVEFGNNLLLQYPWKSWYDNYTYQIDTIDLYDGGNGYTQNPIVTIVPAVGDTGFGATAVAFISLGKVSRIIVTNPGQGYTATPTVIISGGGSTTLTSARAYAQLGNCPVRSNQVRLRFDRTTKEREVAERDFTQQFISNGVDTTFDLDWAPLAQKEKIELTRNGILQLVDSFTIIYTKQLYNPQPNTEYTKLFATLQLTFVPSEGDVLEITYPKSLDLYNAASRIEDYYKPESGMPGISYDIDVDTKELKLNLAQVMKGVEYSGLRVTGLPFDAIGGWDAPGIPWAANSWDNLDVEQGYTSYSTTSTNTQSFTIPTLITTGTEVNVYLKSAVDASVSGKRIDGPVVNITATNTTTFVKTLIGLGTGAVERIDMIVPGKGYQSSFTSLSISAPNKLGGVNATGTVIYQAVDAVITNGGSGYAVGDLLVVTTGTNSASFVVTRVSADSSVTSVNVVNRGRFVGTTVATPIATTSTTAITTMSAVLSLVYSISEIEIGNAGSGYTEAPVITITESINPSNTGTVTIPAFARAVLKAEFTEVNSTTTKSQITIPDIAFTTTSTLVMLRYSSSDGTVVPTDQDSLDALVSGGDLAYTTALGVNPSEIILDGGSTSTRHITGMMDDGFLNSINSYAPEECVPGQIQESFGISVYTQPATFAPVIANKRYYVDGSTRTFKLGVRPTDSKSVIVLFNGQSLLSSNYIINYETNTFTFTSINPGTGWLSITTIQSGSIALVDSFAITTSSNSTVYTSAITFSDVGSVYVTINGIKVEPPVYALTKYKGAARLTVNQSGTIQAYFFKGENKSFSEITEQQFTSTATTATFTLNPLPGNAEPFHSQVIVTKNNLRLKPPITTYYQVAEGQTTFDISESIKFGLGRVDLASIEVYVNGVRVLPTRKWNLEQSLNQITFRSNILSTGDAIAIVIKSGHDYLIQNGQLVLTVPTSDSTSTQLSVTTFTNHDPNFIRTERFNATGSNRYTMQRPILDASYVWVNYNGNPLVLNLDYTVSNDNRTVILRDGIFQKSSDFVLVTSFANVEPTVAYRLFRDMLGRTHYKRLSQPDSTVLSQNLLLSDTNIAVEDASVLTQPDPTNNKPGVILIDGERIEFFVVQGNILRQLRRGTLGTAPKDIHYAGMPVLDQGADQTIPFVEGIQKYTTATTTATEYDLSASITFTNLAPYSDQVEVRYQGMPLLKPSTDENNGINTVKHNFDKAYDSAASFEIDVPVPEDFTISDTGILTLNTATVNITVGAKLEVIKRTATSWYSNTTTSLIASISPQARFLTQVPAALPRYLSSSTYVINDITWYLETNEPLTDENENPLQGM